MLLCYSISVYNFTNWLVSSTENALDSSQLFCSSLVKTTLPSIPLAIHSFGYHPFLCHQFIRSVEALMFKEWVYNCLKIAVSEIWIRKCAENISGNNQICSAIRQSSSTLVTNKINCFCFKHLYIAYREKLCGNCKCSKTIKSVCKAYMLCIYIYYV